MDDRSLRIAVLLSAHLIFLSAAALRIVRGQRSHQLVARSPWWIQYYPPLVWLPFLVAYFQPLPVDLARWIQFAGLAICVLSGAFAAWAMWSLGRSYGIRMDIFTGHRLVTSGAYRLVRHPMYLGIVAFHVGASLALESPLLLAVTVLYVVPFTAIRIAYEERVLLEAFGERYAAYRRDVPALLPFA
jgi:protein-S-isoprenylcysteine O-methyltransferase Ste14